MPEHWIDRREREHREQARAREIEEQAKLRQRERTREEHRREREHKARTTPKLLGDYFVTHINQADRDCCVVAVSGSRYAYEYEMPAAGTFLRVCDTATGRERPVSRNGMPKWLRLELVRLAIVDTRDGSHVASNYTEHDRDRLELRVRALNDHEGGSSTRFQVLEVPA